MKLSTRLKKEISTDLLAGKKIKLCVGQTMYGRVDTYTFASMELADNQHEELIKKGYKILLQESPVINEKEIVIHYTATNYRDWCNM